MKKLFAVCALLFAVCAAGAAYADETQFVVDDAAIAEQPEEVEVRIIIADPAAVVKRAEAKPAGPERRSMASEYDAARIGFVNNTQAKQTATPAATVAAAVVINNPNLECAIGERPFGNTCQRCAQKNNPGVIWKNSGKDCLIEKCANDDEYILLAADTDQPKCLKKCEIWGGTATRAWMGEDFDVCGTGEFIECGDGFNKTNEQTASSEMKYWHCVPNGTRSGACTKNDTVDVCAFPNGKAQQACQNGFWGICILNQFCNTGFVKEDKQKSVYTVNRKKDDKTYVANCVPKKK